MLPHHPWTQPASTSAFCQLFFRAWEKGVLSLGSLPFNANPVTKAITLMKESRDSVLHDRTESRPDHDGMLRSAWTRHHTEELSPEVGHLSGNGLLTGCLIMYSLKSRPPATSSELAPAPALGSALHPGPAAAHPCLSGPRRASLRAHTHPRSRGHVPATHRASPRAVSAFPHALRALRQRQPSALALG